MGIFSLGSFFPWSWPRSGLGAQNKNWFETEPVFTVGGKGIKVTAETLFQTSSLLCAARVLSQGVAQVPLKVFREEDDEKGRRIRKPERKHESYRLLAEQPNDFQTSFVFRETMVVHAVLAGNGYAYVDRRRDGSLRELFPIAPDRIAPRWNDEKRQLEYHWNNGTDVVPLVLKPSQVLHLRGPSWNGFTGLEALQIARAAIGLSATLENEQANASYRGGRPSGVLSNQKPITNEQLEMLRANWVERFGPGGDGGIAILDGDWKFSAMATSAVDAETIASRRFQIEEIARFTMVFPQMLMSNDKTQSYASSEQFFLAHLIHSLDPWMERFEQEIKRVVIGYAGDNAFLYPKFIRDGMLRAAGIDRATAIAMSLGQGGAGTAWRTKNEARALEDLNPIDDPDFDTLPKEANVSPNANNSTEAADQQQIPA